MKNKCHRVENIARKGEIACYNFSFPLNVFHSCISLVRQNAALCGNGLPITTQCPISTHCGKRCEKRRNCF